VSLRIWERSVASSRTTFATWPMANRGGDWPAAARREDSCHGRTAKNVLDFA